MRKIILLLLCALIPVCAIGDSFKISPYSPDTLEIASNRHAQPDDEGKTVPFLDTEGFDLVAESQSVQLYLNQEYSTLRIVDKRTGYVWGAISLSDARKLNKSWKSYAASVVAIECYDQKNNEKRYGLYDDTVETHYTMQENGFTCHINFSALGIEMTVFCMLEDDHVTLHVTEDSIHENGAFKLKSIAFMPYLGSVYNDEIKGWFLLPDGPGALMRFQKSGSYVAGFDERIYGRDLSVSSAMDAQSLGSIRPDDYVREDNQVLLPVYGIAHGVKQNGLLCVVEDGQLYASIVATPAGLGNTQYNSIMTRFEMREKYNMTTNQSGAGAAVPQEAMNAVSPGLTVYLLANEQADYDQMAVFYRNLLQLPVVTGDASPALRLVVLCADAKRSFLPGATATLTTLRQARSIAEDLLSSGVDRLTMVLSHFTKKNQVANDPSTGSMRELADLKETLQSGSSLLLAVDPISANEDQINQRLQAANGMSLSPIKLTRNNQMLLYRDTYLFRPAQVIQRMIKTLERYQDYELALDQVSSLFYGDYTTNQEQTRAQTAEAFESLVRDTRPAALHTPNQSMMQYSSVFLDIPLVSGQYLFETDTVPFLPIILSGSMEMYAPAVNNGSFIRDRMLRMVEYGAYPSFLITAAGSDLLAQTSLSDASSTCFDDWRDFILDTWNYMHAAMDATAGQRIDSHVLEQQGRVRISYENGIVMLVNYTDTIWHTVYGDVQAHDYLAGGIGQ